MNQMEAAALSHATEWVRYSRGPQAEIDRREDQIRRAKADTATGHSPKCSLTKCHPECKKGAA